MTDTGFAERLDLGTPADIEITGATPKDAMKALGLSFDEDGWSRARNMIAAGEVPDALVDILASDSRSGIDRGAVPQIR